MSCPQRTGSTYLYLAQKEYQHPSPLDESHKDLRQMGDRREKVNVGTPRQANQ